MGTLMRQFLGLFVKVAAIGGAVSAIGLSNGDSVSYMLVYSLKMIGLSILGFVSIFMSVIWKRFGKLFRVYQSGKPAEQTLTSQEIAQYIKTGIQYPFSLFRAFLMFGIGFAIFYLVAEWWVNNALLHYRQWDWAWFIKNFLFKLGLVWLLALMLYNGSRKILRPVLSWLAESNPVGFGISMSFRKRILGVVLSLAIMMGMQYMYLLLGSSGESYYFVFLLGFFVLFLALSYFFTRAAIDDIANDIDQVRSSLAEFNSLDFPQSTKRLKVESADEVGDLKVQFNSLQEKAERYYETLSKELLLAYRIQASLLPSTPLSNGHVTVKGRSTSASDLGGDFYDYALMDEHRIVTIIGDVSGKGLPAALVTATVLGLYRAEIRHGGSPAELLQRMNTSLCGVLSPEMYVTAGVLSVDVQTGHYQYASAGHLPPVQVSSNGIVEWEAASLPLGFDPLDRFPEMAGVLATGDCIVLYTDGVLEARSGTGEIVGFETIHHWLRTGNRFPDGILDEIASGLETHRQTRKRQDDETVVVLQFAGQEGNGCGQ